MKIILAILASGLVLTTAHAQSWGRLAVFTNTPALITATTASNTTSGYLQVRRGFGLNIVPRLGVTNSVSTNWIKGTLYGTVDGTNWIANPIAEVYFLHPGGGTNGATLSTNLSATLLDSYYRIRFQAWTNANDTTVWITNVAGFYLY